MLGPSQLQHHDAPLRLLHAATYLICRIVISEWTEEMGLANTSSSHVKMFTRIQCTAETSMMMSGGVCLGSLIHWPRSIASVKWGNGPCLETHRSGGDRHSFVLQLL